MVNFEVPTVVGVPEIVAEVVVLDASVSPAGRVPDVIDHANVPLAPVALITPK
jgi:hypothetical protein